MPSLFSRSRTTSSPLKSQKTSTELSDEFGRVSSRNSARGAVTVPVKKDRNVEKTRTRTLSGVKGRAPSTVPNEEEIVIPDGSFFPLNLDPLGGEPASPSDSERGPYLHFTSFIIFPPHHHPSFSKRWARSRAVLEIVNAVPGATVACRWFALIGPRALAPNPQPWIPFTNNEHHRSSPTGARIWLPLIFPPHRPRSRGGRPSRPHRHRRARHTWSHDSFPFFKSCPRRQLFRGSSSHPSFPPYLCVVPCAGRRAHMARGGPLCCARRTCHVPAMGSRPSFACLWGQCRARPPLMGYVRRVE